MPNLAALLVISAGALDAGGGTSHDEGLKCAPRKDGPPDLPEVVVMVDGALVATDAGQWDHKDVDIAHVEIICWRWIEQQFGIKVRSGAIYVLTHAGIEEMKERRLQSLEALVAAQDRHRATHGTYAAQVRDLADYNPWEVLEFHMRLTEDGWAARIETLPDWGLFLPGEVSESVCHAFVGTAPADWKLPTRREQAPVLTERTPICLRWG